MTNQITTQTQLSTFNFETQQIRVIAVNGEPWFVAKDLCDTLGILNPSKAILNLDDDEKMISSDSNLKLGSAGNGAQSLSLVSESGMYTLILRCRDAVKKGSIPHRFRK
ncbi:TPA: Bro-N domain-containing protein [Haemophilus influenzae]